MYNAQDKAADDAIFEARMRQWPMERLKGYPDFIDNVAPLMVMAMTGGTIPEEAKESMQAEKELALKVIAEREAAGE